jgi:DNA polymerase III epsilon subunit-like protein
MNTEKKAVFSTQDHAQYIIENCIVIDTETTGLGETDVAIELAAVDAETGRTIIDRLIRCDWDEIPKEAYNVHGIGIKELQTATPAAAVIAFLTFSAENDEKQLTAFNMHFDSRILKQTSPLSGFRLDHLFSANICVMELANRHFIKDHGVWKHGQSQFSRLSLAKCCEIAGIEFKGKAHRAMADVLATIDLLHFIANDR